MDFLTAIELCRNSRLVDWDLVLFAQQFVNKHMKYSIENSLDSPQQAFEKGQGYCWHQASALHTILLELGFNSRLVHAFKNYFPEVELAGVLVHGFSSGHVWCRVTINGIEKDVCPGNAVNKPGIVHFQPESKVLEWNKGIERLSYYGAAFVNALRRRKYGKIKGKQENRWNPACCPCKKTKCQRYKKCDECKSYHLSKNGFPSCER